MRGNLLKNHLVDKFMLLYNLLNQPEVYFYLRPFVLIFDLRNDDRLQKYNLQLIIYLASITCTANAKNILIIT